MKFLKTIFWTLVAVVAAIFSWNNWTPVVINDWSGQPLADTWLPFLLLVAFLTGLLPTLLLHRATRWSLRRKLETTQRALVDATVPAKFDDVPAIHPVPPSAAPIAVPPGVA